ncbi:MAG: hypothetical protein JSS81_23050 [Acidobacteria bacterium]|nr:hypothetical protein [Acidobacteriota bacterium]
MSITGDRYVGAYEGHTIELVRNNWNKTLKLFIDGREAASEWQIMPYDLTLTAEFEHAGATHVVTARSTVHFLSSDDTVEIDGERLSLTKVK